MNSQSKINTEEEAAIERGERPSQCTCGMVFDDQIEAWARRIVLIFSGWGRGEGGTFFHQNDFCKNLLSDTYGDIVQFVGAENTNATTTDPSTCGNNLCTGTITIKGQCHFAGEVNYIQFGLANHLCHNFLSKPPPAGKVFYNQNDFNYYGAKDDEIKKTAVNLMILTKHSKKTCAGLVAGYRLFGNGKPNAEINSLYTNIIGREKWFYAGWDLIDDDNNFNFETWKPPVQNRDPWKNAVLCEKPFLDPITGNVSSISFP